MNIIKRISEDLNIDEKRIEATLKLINEGCTIPFIARYRKEVTNNMDDITLRKLEELYSKYIIMDQREKTIINSLKEQGLFNDDLKKAIEEAKTLQDLEDIYLPYKPKRKTRASEAKRKGLLPLSELILKQRKCDDFDMFVSSFFNEEIKNKEDALNGAKDIIAENISENRKIRRKIRFKIKNEGYLVCKNSKENSLYEIYYDFKQEIKYLPPHRILAINRGENEGVLKVKLEIDKTKMCNIISHYIIKNDLYADILKEAIEDSYSRLLLPSLTSEIRSDLKEYAEDESLKVFSSNARSLLLEPPLKNKIVLGFDPGFRTGCKLAIVNENGDLLYIGVIYPTAPLNKIEESRNILISLIDKYKVDVIALGNGTASRESEAFLKPIVKEKNINYIMVDEAGASIYSASSLASIEFPHLEASQRSAISLARRLQDPLCELVKIPSKSLGVGQYQYDMNQKRLKESLDNTVIDCVNAVGVDINSASKSLLCYVSGINSSLADNLINYRIAHKRFKNRQEFLNVPKLGNKVFLQCAGFLRIRDGDEVFDKTNIHPEQYEKTKKLLKMFDLKESDLGSNKLIEKLSSISIDEVCAYLDMGKETLKDIIEELEKPDRDIRGASNVATLRSDIVDISNLKVGMILEGTVRNVMDFGAFVDIGVHQDGLIHISELSSSYVRHPLDVIKLHDIVKVKVISLDLDKKRIGLSLKDVEK